MRRTLTMLSALILVAGIGPGLFAEPQERDRPRKERAERPDRPPRERGERPPREGRERRRDQAPSGEAVDGNEAVDQFRLGVADLRADADVLVTMKTKSRRGSDHVRTQRKATTNEERRRRIESMQKTVVELHDHRADVERWARDTGNPEGARLSRQLGTALRRLEGALAKLPPEGGNSAEDEAALRKMGASLDSMEKALEEFGG